MRLLVSSTLIASMVFTATGCTTMPDGTQQVSKGAVGALIGAAAGAAIDRKNHGRGAAIGALLGGGAGVYMDRQAAKMKQQMAGTGVDVDYDQATGALKLVMPGNITFDTNKANLSPAFTATLDKVASTLTEYKDTTITVNGYTDNRGNVALNKDLSVARASSVANYLSNKGVSTMRMSTMGYGMDNPVATNDTDAGRAENRRVEITINPTAAAASAQS